MARLEEKVEHFIMAIGFDPVDQTFSNSINIINIFYI
jgi:hypothetical protein